MKGKKKYKNFFIIFFSFFSVRDLYEPTDDGSQSKVFITKSYDPETHFGMSVDDILQVYKRITGKEMDLTPPKKDESEKVES